MEQSPWREIRREDPGARLSSSERGAGIGWSPLWCTLTLLSRSICLGPASSKEAQMRLSKCCSPAPLIPADSTSPLAGVGGALGTAHHAGICSLVGLPIHGVATEPCLPAWTTEQKQISFPHILRLFQRHGDGTSSELSGADVCQPAAETRLQAG